MLTAKDMQGLLQVDRSTIYRMADAGRLPALKVGKQWRFPADLIETWLQSRASVPLASHRSQGKGLPGDFASLLPLECVQLVQDTIADSLGIMVIITDMTGNPVTRVSRPCGLFEVISEIPDGVQRCIESWQLLAATIDLEPRYVRSHLGLLCARALVRVEVELKGMVVVGGLAPDDWPPPPNEINVIANEFGIQPERVKAHLSEVYYLDQAERARLLPFVQRIANIVSHLATERSVLRRKLESVASFTAVE
jgi:excisionase family DNA binding protein